MNNRSAGVRGGPAWRGLYKGGAVIVQWNFAGRAFAFGWRAQSATRLLTPTWLGLQIVHETVVTQTHPYRLLGNGCMGPTA